jgi:hypothetical protein
MKEVHMRYLIFVWILATFTAAAYGQGKNVPDCIQDVNGNCRTLGIRQVSATNAANTITINAPNVVQLLIIHAVCSAGTAALTVSGATDGTNFLTLDTITAAATQIKQYQQATVGAAIALSPLGFQYIRISVATCGVGNTSTLTVSAKGT